MCHMSCIQISIFRGISNHRSIVMYLINMKILDISSHILIINESFWKLELLIRCSLTVTSVGCFRMPSSSLKHTGPTRDTCLVNALMGWVPWWTRPDRTAHALPLKRGKHAQCDTHSLMSFLCATLFGILLHQRTCIYISWYACVYVICI